MKHLRAILAVFLLATCTSMAAQRIKLTIQITNAPVTGDSLTVNADLREWTNTSAAGFVLTNLVGINESTTNLYDQIASFPYSGALIQRWSDTNEITLLAPLGAALSASQVGTWSVLTLSTQSGSSTFTALWPMESMPGATNRTNQASSFVSGLSDYSTQAFATNATALSNFLTLGAAPLQQVDGSILVVGGISGVLSMLTNGYSTNLVLEDASLTNAWIDSGTFTNGAIVGASQVDIIGSGVENAIITTGTNTIAAVSTVIALQRENGITNAVDDGDVLGNIVFTGHGTTTKKAGARIQAIADETFTDSSAATELLFGTTPTGAGATVTRLTIAPSGDVTVADRLLVSGSTSNLTSRGVSTVNGRVDYTSLANTGLANGNNADVNLATNTYNRLSGGTTIATINGFNAQSDGSFHIVQISGAVTNIIANDSGVDPTAANRIITGTGADVELTNNPAFIQVIYDAAASRWRLITWTD